jgi:hypothetical protein
MRIAGAIAKRIAPNVKHCHTGGRQAGADAGHGARQRRGRSRAAGRFRHRGEGHRGGGPAAGPRRLLRHAQGRIDGPPRPEQPALDAALDARKKGGGA